MKNKGDIERHLARLLEKSEAILSQNLDVKTELTCIRALAMYIVRRLENPKQNTRERSQEVRRLMRQTKTSREIENLFLQMIGVLEREKRKNV